jgi:hypothetical protein
VNTPSHAILNLTLLSQSQSIPFTLPIALGAVLPDAPIFVLYFWAKFVRRQPEYQIWRETYELPFWQNIVAAFHSIPLALIGIAITHYWGWHSVKIIFLSMIFHSLLDLPVHNHDAHRHFFPFSNYRFISPLSYWDRQHYGGIVSFVEKLLVLGATIYIFPAIDSWLGKGLLIGVNLFYWLIFLYFRVVKSRLATNVE